MGEPELLILPVEESYVLVYQIRFRATDHKSWIAFLRADDGAVIRYNKMFCDLVDGTGNIYSSNPFGALTQVTLPGLLSTGYLENTDTYTEVGNQQTKPYQSNYQFTYTPPHYTLHDPTYFDAVNAYYHTNKYLNYMKTNFGFSGLGYRLRIRVHDGTYGAAGYDWGDAVTPPSVAFHYEDQNNPPHRRDPAKWSDIIYHEIQHGISNKQNLPPVSAFDNSSLHEGYSDYFAASYTNSPILGQGFVYNSQYDHVRTANTVPAEFNYGNRFLLKYNQLLLHDPPNVYQNNILGPHVIGMIWSGALWDIRKVLGQAVTDKIVWASLGKTSSPTMIQAAQDVISADMDLYPASPHTATLQSIFLARGLINSSGFSVSIYGPSCFCAGQTGTYTAVVSGGDGAVDFEWSKAVPCTVAQLVGGDFSNDPCNQFSIFGNNTYQVSLNSPEFLTLRVKATHQGVSTYATKTINVLPGIIPSDPNYNTCNSCNGTMPKEAESEALIPERFELFQNFPNPFNPSTTIRFGLPTDERVRLTIYNLLGQEVRTLVDNKPLGQGFFEVEWDGKDNTGHTVASGAYVYQITAGSFTKSQKMLFLK